MTAKFLLVLAIISFVLLIISLVAYKSRNKAVLARLGFSCFALVPIIFLIYISNLNQKVESLSQGIIGSFMDFTPFPLIALILAIIGIIFFVEHPTNFMIPVKRKRMSIKKMAMWSAIFIVLMYGFHFPIFPQVPFLDYVPTDISVFMVTFAFGPIAGFVLTIIVSVLQGLTVSAVWGFYGIIWNIIATGSFVLVAGNLYKRKKSRKSFLISMVAGTAVMLIVMFGAHLVVTPSFTGWTIDIVLSQMPSILAFYLIKIGFNSIVTFLLYIRTDEGIKEQD
jgi:riboflavin transporter FmnP